MIKNDELQSIEINKSWKHNSNSPRNVQKLRAPPSIVGLGVLWVSQALFLKIFGKFEKCKILFICLVFSYDETSLRYLDLNFSKNVPKRGGGVFHGKYVPFWGTYYFVPMIYIMVT